MASLRILLGACLLWRAALAQTPCTSLADCEYQGCALAAVASNYYGCNCQVDQIKSAETGLPDTYCFLGNEENVVASGTCVKSDNYAATFAQCPAPCPTTCSAGFYVNNCACAPCPSGFTCSGTAPPCPTSCPAGQYLDQCSCKDCAMGFYCANSVATACPADKEYSPARSTSVYKCESKCLAGQYKVRISTASSALTPAATQLYCADFECCCGTDNFLDAQATVSVKAGSVLAQTWKFGGVSDNPGWHHFIGCGNWGTTHTNCQSKFMGTRLQWGYNTMTATVRSLTVNSYYGVRFWSRTRFGTRCLFEVYAVTPSSRVKIFEDANYVTSQFTQLFTNGFQAEATTTDIEFRLTANEVYQPSTGLDFHVWIDRLEITEIQETCDACLVKFFCANNSKYTCPGNSSSAVGSSTVDNCICNSGMLKQPDALTSHRCTPCDANFYCPSQTSQLACPDTQWSPPSSSVCFRCQPGFYWINNMCTVCPGFNKYCMGNDALTQCPGSPYYANYFPNFQTWPGAKSKSECIDFYNVPPQCVKFHGQCACKYDRTGVTLNSMVGSTGDWWGTWMNWVWDDQFYTGRLATTNTQIGDGWISFTMPDARMISGGVVQVADNQQPKGAYFEVWVGNSSTITDNVRCYASPNLETYLEYFSCGVVGSVVYFYRPPNVYRDWFLISEVNLYTPSATGCSAATYNKPSCGLGNYYNSSALCDSCPSNSYCTDGLFAAPCPSGYYCSAQFAYKCKVCVAGQFKISNCTRTENSVCGSCPANFTSSLTATSIGDCVCLSGYLAESGSCRACRQGYACPSSTVETRCLPGTWAAAASTTCTTCAVGTYCPGDDNRYTCPATTTSILGSRHIDNCTCVTSGYVRNGTNACRPCTMGNYCPNSFSEITCPASTYAANIGQAACTACPANSVGPAGSTTVYNCTCASSYIEKRVLAACTTVYPGCASGDMSERNLARSCGPNRDQPCPVTLFNDVGNASAMVVGQGYCSATACTPASRINDNILNQELWIDGQWTIQIDLQEWQQVGQIATYLEGGADASRQYYSEVYLGEKMERCANNMATNWGSTPQPSWRRLDNNDVCYGQTTRMVWVRMGHNGWERRSVKEIRVLEYAPSTKICNLCAAGSFCPTDTTQLQCPTNHTSLGGSLDISRCFCMAGYVNTGNLSCRACRAGYSCPLPSTTGVASGQPVDTLVYTETICPTGTFSPPAAAACTSCVANTYSDLTGLAECKLCPLNSQGPAGSTSKANCACNNGYYRNIDLNCLLCPAGYRCTANQMFICPIGTSSAMGASACTPCAQGTYSANTGRSACSVCPDGSIVPLETTVNLFNDPINRATRPDETNTIVILRNFIPTGSSAVNLTKWTFYAWQSCTITPVIAQHTSSTGDNGYGTFSMQVKRVGTTRYINGAGTFTYDFLEGSKVLTNRYTSAGSGLYSNMEYFGFYYTGRACIPFDPATPPATLSLNRVFQSTPYNTSLPIASQTFTATVPTTPARHDLLSVSLAYSITSNIFATPLTGSVSVSNCTCAAGNFKTPDGGCSGSCIDGKWMVDVRTNECRLCSQGMYCSSGKNMTCPTQTSSLPGSSQCQPCTGPDTHTNISLSMCGLIQSCTNSVPQPIPGTLWRGLGRFRVGRGGDGEVPSSHWYSGFRCMGMVLAAAADRPVALLEQTLTVVAGKTYAVRFKVVCTGPQCGAQFHVSVADAVLYDAPYVSRNWLEAATPYFTPTSTSVTVRFRAQMITQSCVVWLGSLELVDMEGWQIESFNTLRLRPGDSFPVRHSATYVIDTPQIGLQILAGGYIQQAATVLPFQQYELLFWSQGSPVAEYLSNGTLLPMQQTGAYDSFAGWTQSVYRVASSAEPTLTVRISGVATITPPSLKIYAPLTSRPCLECLANYWCRGTTINACPLNTISNASSSLQTDCFCKPGYYGKVELGPDMGYSPCAICPMNSYCNGGNHRAFCPPGTKSQPGSSLSGCTLCAEGEYCDQGHVGICPGNSYSPTGSDNLEDCSCMPGYYGTLGNCTLCESGFFCNGGPVRMACTANAVSPPGSIEAAQCFCGRGYYGLSNVPCTVCPEGSWCWTGVLNSCPADMWSPVMSSYQTECVCQYGFTGPNGGPCTPCSTGTFKPLRGTDACTLCAAGRSSAAVAATSSGTCASCNRGSHNPFAGQSACTSCAAGSFANAFGATVCAQCGVGTWSSVGFAECSNCVAGTYSNTTGNAHPSMCLTCDQGQFSGAAATVCGTCGYCSYWSYPQRITLRATGPAASLGPVGSNSQTQLALTSATMALATSGASFYTLSLATGASTLISYEQQSTASITHIATSQDRASVYVIQDKVYKFSLEPQLFMERVSEFWTLSTPRGVVEALDGNSLYVFTTPEIVQYDMFETQIGTVPYPTGFTSLVTNGCVHTSYPDFVFVAGSSVTNPPWGFRKFSVITKQWQLVTTNVSKTNKCFFTPDGHFIFLTSSSPSQQTYVYSVTENTITPFSTGQVTGLLVDPNSNYVLTAIHNSRVDKIPIVVEDARNCGPGLYSLQAGLPSPSLCEQCPAGNVCPSGASITPCAPGTYSQATGMRTQAQCTLCPPGWFCTGGTGLDLCPLGSYSLATGVVRSQDCSGCPAGFYCPNTTVINACPANTMSAPRSSDLASCTCNAGYRCEVTKVVHAEVTLPITVEDFESLRQQYILAVAKAAGVDPSQVVIVSVTTSAAGAGGRRLLDMSSLKTRHYIDVHTSIYNSKYSEMPHLALVSLQMRLAEQGLPPHQPGIKVTLHREVQSAVRALARR